jgi:hypothetical protein
MSRALVAGWFSFEGMGATAGDLLSRDLCAQWLREQGWVCDLAVAPPFEDGSDWRSADPADYELVVFVCGPLGNGWPVVEFLEHFKGRRILGLNLSMLDPVDGWNPFDVLIERDSDRTARADIVFLSAEPRVPVVGVVLVHEQREYKDRMHKEAGQAIRRLMDARDIAQVEIDTRLDLERNDLRNPRQIETMIASMDAIVTTRLHGMVLAIKHGVPPLVIDPVPGGRKVLAQARAIGWPIVFTADDLSDERLKEALDYCLSAEGRAEAARSRARAISSADEARQRFLRAIGGQPDADSVTT